MIKHFLKIEVKIKTNKKQFKAFNPLQCWPISKNEINQSLR